MHKCPHCGAEQRPWRLRSEFVCESCGGHIRSNAMSLGIIGIILASVLTSFVPTTEWSLSVALLAYFGVSAFVVGALMPFVHLEKSMRG